MVSFDYPTWSARFPELVTRASSAQVIALAGEVPLYFDLNLVTDPTQVLPLMNLVVAHLVEITYPTGTSPSSQGLVGRVTSASKGSVSVSVDAGPVSSAIQSWWYQSKYGVQLWTLTSRYRTFRYVPGFVRRRPLIDRIP